ncbi:MAG: hypothetical protein FD128_2844, partial [Hyphomonadaceae bacterium]
TEVAIEDVTSADAAPATIDVPQTGFFSAMTDFFTQFTPKPATPAPEKSDASNMDMVALASAFQSGVTEMQAQLSKWQESNAAQIAALSAEVKAAQAKFDAAPATNHTPRPLSTGADTQIKARC